MQNNAAILTTVESDIIMYYQHGTDNSHTSHPTYVKGLLFFS